MEKRYLVFYVKNDEVTEFLGTSTGDPAVVVSENGEEYDDPRQIVDTTIKLPRQFMLGRTYPCKAWVNSHGKTQIVYVDLDSKALSL